MARRRQEPAECDFLQEDEDKNIYYCKYWGPSAPLEESDLENRCTGSSFSYCTFYKLLKSKKKKKPEESKCELLREDEKKGIIYCAEMGPKNPLRFFDLRDKCGNRFYVSCDFFRSYIKRQGKDPDDFPAPFVI